MARSRAGFGVARQARKLVHRPQSLVLVRAARQLVTLHGAPGARYGGGMSALAVIPDGALLIRNGRIEDVGPTRRIERLKTAQDAVEVDATGSLVMPAFVDTGVRPVCAPNQTKRSLLEASASNILAGMARHGTLIAGIMTDGAEDLADALRLLRIYAALQGRPVTLIPSVALRSATDVERMRTVSLPLLQMAAQLGLASSAAAVVDSRPEGVGEFHEFFSMASALGMNTVVHAAPGYSKLAANIASNSNARVISGLEPAPEHEMRKLAESRIIVSVAPAVTNVQSHIGFVSSRFLIDQGGALALGTHFCRDENRDYNMLHTLSLACRHTGMTTEEAITAGTINAAHAAGCARDYGSLEPGKWADLVIYDCANYSELLRSGAVNQVVRVLRQGRTIYRRGRVGEPD